MLDADNYLSGFLMDEEWMAGVTQDPENPGSFIAFILDHTLGEYKGCHSFKDLKSALEAINRIKRSWVFELTQGCDGNSCEKCEKNCQT